MAVTVLVKVWALFVKSLVFTVSTFPEMVRKSVSVVERLMVQLKLGQIDEWECVRLIVTVFATVSSISMSERVKGVILSFAHGHVLTATVNPSRRSPPCEI